MEAVSFLACFAVPRLAAADFYPQQPLSVTRPPSRKSSRDNSRLAQPHSVFFFSHVGALNQQTLLRVCGFSIWSCYFRVETLFSRDLLHGLLLNRLETLAADCAWRR